MKRIIPTCIALVLWGCDTVEMVPPAKITPLSDIRVSFDSFINVGYKQGRSLPGLQTTCRMIQTTLGLWYQQLHVRQTMIDGTPTDLRRFLKNLPGPQACDISVVYLGSIQTSDGALAFTDGQRISWHDLLATPFVKHPCRIVILDVCHAAVVKSIPKWHQQFSSVTLLATDVDEVTYQFEPIRLKPINIRKHYPQVQDWAHYYLEPGWDHHVSFLGLIWLATGVDVTVPPMNKAAWVRFFENCCQKAIDFRHTKSNRWASTLLTLVDEDAVTPTR